MSLEQEKQLIGKESNLVPTADSGEYCNGKKTKKKDNGMIVFTGYCNAEAGKWTDHVGEGRCKYHGGCSTGAPEGNQNRTTHGIYANPHYYHQSLDAKGKEFVRDISASIEDRIRSNTGRVDYVDRALARRIAIKLHIVSKASDYVENHSGLVETITAKHSSRNTKAALLGEIRRYDDSIFSDLKRLGVLYDHETQKADALSS